MRHVLRKLFRLYVRFARMVDAERPRTDDELWYWAMK